MPNHDQQKQRQNDSFVGFMRGREKNQKKKKQKAKDLRRKCEGSMKQKDYKRKRKC